MATSDTLVNVPGVKIREVQLVGPPIAGVGTSMPGFVGKAPTIENPRFLNKPNLVTSLDQFVRDYINNPIPEPDDEGNVDEDAPDPNKPEAKESTPLSHAILGYFQNGGGPCYIIDVGEDGDVADGVAQLADLDVQIIAAPGSTDADVYEALTTQAESMRDRFAILDAPDGDNIAIADMLKTMTAGGHRPDRDSPWAALYFPQIQVPPALEDDPKPSTEKIWVAPTGHIAGVYARVDALRGVHKAPANEVLLRALGVRQNVKDEDQEVLNKDGVNAIRLFSQGPTVFGARTLQDNKADTTFRYISTRRLVTYVEQSLKVGLRFAVFEPNNVALRQKIARSARGFLDGVWRDGALFGATAEDAYYVRFPDAFNTDDDRALGKLTLEVGLRVAFPAEFIIVRIGVLLQSASTA